MFKERLRQALGRVSAAAQTTRGRFLEQIALQEQRDRLLARIAGEMPQNPVLQGRKIYAQTDEDGIIAEIFRRIGTTSRVFLELGCGPGHENNTLALLLQGWRGLWVDGDPRHVTAIRAALPHDPITPSMLLSGAFVTRDTIRGLCERALGRLGAERLDFLSLDFDGNDLHFLTEIIDLRPRVLCCEYNGQLGPEIEGAVAYDSRHVWQGDDYQGMSLAAARALVEPRGYVLVSCNLSGVNAFFVERDLARPFGGYDPALLFQPPRYHLIFLEDYNPRTLRFAAQTVRYDML